MSYYYYTPSSSDLQHYGVLGMHWGIRRYQPYSTTGPRKGGKTGREIGEAADSKSNKNSSKSGLTEGQKKALKYAAIGLGVAAAAGVGYLAWQKYGRQYVDITLKAGKTLQTLSRETDRINIGDSFYASINNRDKNIYKVFLGHVRGGDTTAYSISSKVTDKLKIASPNNSGKVFSSIFDKDDNFKKQVQKLALENKGVFAYKQGFEDIANGKATSKAYDAFNFMLAGHGEGYDEPKRKFFEALKQAGYAGLIDVNDRSYNSVNAKAPVIVFDKSKLIANSIHQLSEKEIDMANFMALDTLKKEQLTNYLVQNLTGVSATSSAALGATWLKNVMKDQDKKSA